MVKSGKDIWDKIQIIGTVLVPIIAVILTAVIAKIVKSSFDKRRLGELVIQLLTLLASNDPRQEELARELLEVEPSKEKQEGGKSCGELLKPDSLVSKVRNILEREGPPIKPFKSLSHRLCYGWVAKFMAPIWDSHENSWKNGLVHGRWLIFLNPVAFSGVCFAGGVRYAFSREELQGLPDHGIWIHRLPNDFPTNTLESIETTDYAMVGYHFQASEATLMAGNLRATLFEAERICTETHFDEVYVGFLVVRPGGDSLVGLVSNQSLDGNIVVVRWQVILECIARLSRVG